MKDVGHEETEKILEEIEKRISAEYAQAEKEIAEKLDDYLKKFRVKDELKLKAVENGMITKEEYEQWRVGQVMMGKRWAELRDSLAEDFTNADKIARSIAYNHMPEVYAINHDYGTFQVEKASQMDTSYTLYDRQAFEQLVKNEDTFIPAPGRKVSRDIKEGKALAWNKKQVQSVMMQGLLQGESIPKLATQLAKTVGESDRKAAIRNARTMTTGVQNAGRMASYDRANKMGIKTQKQWLATLDARTRHWHASLDGEVMDNDEPFVNEFGEIMYPGDPEAAPMNIFNCRCTLIASIKGFERDVSDLDLRHDEHLEDMTYDEWREGHYDQKSDPITKQDDIAETMQNVYGAEYKKYKNLTDAENDVNIQASNKGLMQRHTGGTPEPMPTEQFNKIRAAFERQGGVIQMDAQAIAYLDFRNADGLTLSSKVVLMRPNPSRATVFEEMIHTAQFRRGEIVDLEYDSAVCEVKAKEKLLKNSEAYHLTDKDIEDTKRLLENDRKTLQRLEERRAW